MQSMKSAFFTLCLLLVTTLAFGQHCCEAPGSQAHAQFADLGSDPNFRAMHDNFRSVPAPATGKMITFPVEGGNEGRAYYVESKKKTRRWLIVVHEWWGLNDNIKHEAEVWQEKLGGDVHVLAVDLYDGAVAANREEAGKAMQGLTPERASAILQGALAYAPTDAVFATIGWCMGGGWSHQASLLAGTRGKACAIYYGSPELDVERLKSELHAPVIFIWPKDDRWINEELVSKFENAMTQAGKSLVVKAYEADHAFANPTSQNYEATASQQANAAVLAFFQTHFK